MRDVLDPNVMSLLERFSNHLSRPVSASLELMQHYEIADNTVKLARAEYFININPIVRDLLDGGTIWRIATHLSGCDVALYKEKINFKCPGGAGYSPHQDFLAYPHGDRHLTCMVPIDAANTDNGCLEVAHHDIDVALPYDINGVIPKATEMSMSWTSVDLEPGDLLWIDSRLAHRSGRNRTDQSRRALFATYTVGMNGAFRDAYYQLKRDFFSKTRSGSAELSLIRDFEGVSPTPEQIERHRAELPDVIPATPID